MHDPRTVGNRFEFLDSASEGIMLKSFVTFKMWYKGWWQITKNNGPQGNTKLSLMLNSLMLKQK